MTRLYPSLYKKGAIWMFRYTNLEGNRVKKSTGTENKTRAQQYVREFVDKLGVGCDPNRTLREILMLYQNPDTNPRLRDARMSGGQYGPRYIGKITRDSKSLIAVMDKRKRKLLDTAMFEIPRVELKFVGTIIVQEYGQTVKARGVYKLLKLVFSQAADDGIINANPAVGLPDIKATPVKTLYALPPGEIKNVIANPALFPSELARDLFIVMASTGLRRSELLALSPSQIKGSALVVDRAFKDDCMKVIGTPKWGKVRVLALPTIAQEALQRIFSTRVEIGISSRLLATWMTAVGQHASELKGVRIPEAWTALTPHMLRHSINSMLRVSGLPDVLVSEYMSWAHQSLMQDPTMDQSMQERYTHLYAENLQRVADMVDHLIGEECGLKLSKTV